MLFRRSPVCRVHVAATNNLEHSGVRSVRPDDSAIAGFFEDLPVLLIVLAGVAILVFSGVSASERISRESAQRSLDATAARFVDSIMLSLSRSLTDQHVSLSAIMSVNVSLCAGGTLCHEFYRIAFVELYPDVRWIRVETDAMGVLGGDTGYASRLINAVMDDGAVGIVGVTAFVWRQPLG
jgi:hypothetical protein